MDIPADATMDDVDWSLDGGCEEGSPPDMSNVLEAPRFLGGEFPSVFIFIASRCSTSSGVKPSVKACIAASPRELRFTAVDVTEPSVTL